MIVCVPQTNFKNDPSNRRYPPTPSVDIDCDLKRHNCVFPLSGWLTSSIDLLCKAIRNRDLIKLLLLCSFSHLATWSCLCVSWQRPVSLPFVLSVASLDFPKVGSSISLSVCFSCWALKSNNASAREWNVVGQLVDCVIHTGKALLLFYWYDSSYSWGI